MPNSVKYTPSLLILCLCAFAPCAIASVDDVVYPEGATIVAEAVDPAAARLDVYLDLPAAFLAGERDAAAGVTFDEAWLQAASVGALQARRAGGDTSVRSVALWIVRPDAAEQGWIPLRALLEPITPPPPRRGEPALGALAGPPLVSVGAPTGGQPLGALSGKVVYVSAGHGFTWSQVLDRWATQRGNTHGVVEDLVSAEAIDHYLVPYLRNAGAQVFTVREHDLQTEMVIVDAEPGGATSLDGAGAYEESGGWTDSVVPGFKAGLAPYQGQAAPFAEGGNRVIATVSGQPTAWARWTPEVPENGHYIVYVSYSQDASRAHDAHYAVTHTGGTTHLRVNQERHGSTWVELGRFHFSEAVGSVTLYNDSIGEPGDWISADAVRFGGGHGDVARGTGNGAADSPTSLRPRWEESSRYYSQFSGAPPSVYDKSGDDHSDDVGNRSRYAAWQNEPGEDAVYVAWHTNAPDGGRGTSTWVYGPNSPNGDYIFTGVDGSDLLAQLIHQEILGDVRATWLPDWKDRGLLSAWFGELNPSHNPEMPAALVEVAFHATAADVDYLAEPRFRQTVARAYMQAIIRYFATRDGFEPVLPPDTPRALSVQADPGAGGLRVAWLPPDADDEDVGGDPPETYLVYRSSNGHGFDDGTPVEPGAQSLLVTDVTPGTPVWFRVAAVNEGGVSLPTATIGAVPPCPGQPADGLAVMGFYRLDAFSLPVDSLGPWSLGEVMRLRQQEVNTYAYQVQHIEAFAAVGVAVDGAEALAVEVGDVPLDGYRLVDWQLGEESTVDTTFTPTEQQRIEDWTTLGDGRVLFVSGAELGWDLDAKGDSADVGFLTDTLGVEYIGDDAGTYAGSIAGIGDFTFDDGTGATYDVDYPDVFAPVVGAEVVATYGNDAGALGVRFDAPEGYVAVTMGVPFETIAEPEVRVGLIGWLADVADVAAVVPDACGDDPIPGADAGTGGVPETDAAGSADSASSPHADSMGGEAGSTGDAAPGDDDAGPSPTDDAAPGTADETSGPATTATATAGPTSTRVDHRSEGCGGGPTGPSSGLLGAMLVALALVRRRGSSRRLV